MTIVTEVRGIFQALRSKAREARVPDMLGVRQPELATLVGFLDWYRQVIVNKVDGLSLEDASRVMTPTGMSPLGIVKHLTWAEARWFRDTFADVFPGDVESNDESFRVDPDDTVERRIAAYRAECDQSRLIVKNAGALDQLSIGTADVRGRVTLRWILVHMIEETARHAGHLDMMREQIDGRTGD